MHMLYMTAGCFLTHLRVIWSERLSYPGGRAAEYWRFNSLLWLALSSWLIIHKISSSQWMQVEPACVHLLFEGLGPQTSLPLTEQQHTVRSDDGVDCGSFFFFRGNFASVISEPEWLNNTLSKGQSNRQIHSGSDCVEWVQLQTKTANCVPWK